MSSFFHLVPAAAIPGGYTLNVGSTHHPRGGGGAAARQHFRHRHALSLRDCRPYFMLSSLIG